MLLLFTHAANCPPTDHKIERTANETRAVLGKSRLAMVVIMHSARIA